MFAIVAVNFEAYQDLPPPDFKLMVALARYANRAGSCCPSLSQLARDVLVSVPTVSRYLDRLEGRGCFTRERQAGGRYFYTLAERFRPGWPEKRQADRAIAILKEGVAAVAGGISQRETQKVFPEKYSEKVRESARASPPSLSEGEIPDGWEAVAAAERHRAGLPEVDLRIEWRKHVLYFADQGRPIRLGSWLIWAVRTRLDHTNAPSAAPAASTRRVDGGLPGTDQEKARARSWAKTGRWAPPGINWGPEPDRPDCTLPPGLLAWCRRERTAQEAA